MIRITLVLAMLGTLLVVSAWSAGPATSAPAAVAASLRSAAPTPPAQAWPVPVDFKTYVPQFSTAKTEFAHYWIADRGRRIALLGCHKQGTCDYRIGLFRHFPGQSLGEDRIKDSEILDFVSMPGLQLCTNWIGAPAMRDVPGEMKLDSSDPRRLTIRLSWKKSAADFGTQVIHVAYDPDLARYVIHVEDDLQLGQPGGGEYCNFYGNGLGDFRPGVSRYNRLLYQDANDGGKLKAHYVSTVASKPARDLISVPPGSLIGYADEKDGNPVVIVEETTPPTALGVCACWYDTHITWDEPRIPHGRGTMRSNTIAAAVPGPPYRYHAKLKAYWNSPAETSALLAKAQTVSLASFADRFKNVLPIEMNLVNDFEHTADFLAGNVKHIYFPTTPVKRNGSVEHDTTTGRSGHSSMRFNSNTDKGIQGGLMGPELMVTPGRQLKISAWVKTVGVTGEGFYLESGFQRWTLRGDEQLGPTYRSAKLTGTNDWTLLEIPMPITPPQAEFLKGRVTFRLAGKGTAWVDDFIFAEQDAGGPPMCDPKTL